MSFPNAHLYPRANESFNPGCPADKLLKALDAYLINVVKGSNDIVQYDVDFQKQTLALATRGSYNMEKEISRVTSVVIDESNDIHISMNNFNTLDYQNSEKRHSLFFWSPEKSGDLKDVVKELVQEMGNVEPVLGYILRQYEEGQTKLKSREIELAGPRSWS